MKLDNGIILVCYNQTDDSFSVQSGGRWFLKKARFEEGSAVTVRAVDLEHGEAIEVEYASGCAYTLALYEGSAFVYIKMAIHNPNADPITIHKITPFAGVVDLGAPARDLRVLGCDGLDSADKPRTGYVFLAIAEPETRAGIVCGWLTDNRGSGVVSSAEKDGLMDVEARLEYGKLIVKAGETAEGETLAIGFFDDALSGLEAYADAIAKANDITLPDLPSGYCTWYHARALDAAKMAELADFCSSNLRQYGLEFLQIDDGWQISRRDFTTHNPDGSYPDGMKATAETISSQGYRPGIWFTPFGWDSERPDFAERQDWFVKREDGSVYSVHWGGDCLDMSHPEAKEFLREVVERVTKEWGYEYLKLDALWTGLAAKILYPDPAYRDEGFGDAVFHDPDKTNVEAYRDGLKLVREATGEGVFLLGCTISQNMRTFGASLGLLDAMRIGRDIGAKWSNILPCAKIGAHLYFLNGKVWYNDPDCLMLRDPLTLDQARAWGSWIAISGQLNVVSEWLPGLPPEKLDVVKRTMPNHGQLGRPIDLFESVVPRIWRLQTGEGEESWDTLGLFNWDTEDEARISVDLSKLAPAEKTTETRRHGEEDDLYVGFDFWENEFVPPFTGPLEMSLRPGSCRIISIRPLLDRPQLVSTSRHVTQGLIDVVEEKWDERENALNGKSRVVGEDPYELRIFAGSWQAVSADVQEAGVSVEMKQSGSEVRLTIESSDSREVSWKVVFR